MSITQSIKYALMSKPLKLLSIISTKKIWAATAIRSIYTAKHYANTKRPLYNYQSIKFKKTKTNSSDPCDTNAPKSKPMTACYEEVKAVCPSQYQMLIDVRCPEEIQCLGKIPKSINIPEEELTNALKLPESLFQEKYGSAKPVMDAEIIFYSNNGIRSKHAMIRAMKAMYLKYGLRLDARYLQDSAYSLQKSYQDDEIVTIQIVPLPFARNYKAGFTEYLSIEEEKELERELAETKKKRTHNEDKPKRKKE